MLRRELLLCLHQFCEIGDITCQDGDIYNLPSRISFFSFPKERSYFPPADAPSLNTARTYRMLHQKLLLLCLSVISSTAFFHRSDKSKIVSPSNDLVSRSNNAALSNSCQGYQNLWATPILAIGNGGKGTKSCETHFSSGSDYAPVTGIESWLSNDGYRISGLRLIYATGAESPIVRIQ